MENKKVLVFDIKAALGFFKIGEVTRATVSYPFTRTSIIGILSGILGKERNKYWERNDPISQVDIGLELINPIRHIGFMVNYTHTKYTVNVAKTLAPIIPCQSGKDFQGFVTNVRLDYLRDIHYRIYLHSDDDQLYNELKTKISENDFEYPPYLGHANLLADILYLGESKIEKIEIGQVAQISTVIPATYIDIKAYQSMDSTITIVLDIPIRMIVKNGQIVEVKSMNFIIPRSKNPIPVKANTNFEIFHVKYPDSQIEIPEWDFDEKKYIIFMPNS
ncbi:MAG: hypothetical protein ACTSYY_02150 [Promethearchaeota archaeon]